LCETDVHVCGDSDIHHLRVGQIQVVHQVHIFIDRLHLKARVERPLFTNCADGITLVVVSREDHRVVWQLQELAKEGFILRTWVSVLEVSATGSSDQKGVTRENAVRQEEAIGVVGMARRVEHIECDSFDLNLVTLGDAHRHDINTAVFAHYRDALGVVTERTKSSDVIRMEVCVHRFHQLQIELADQLKIAIYLLKNWIDDQRLATTTTC
jgi:hypothetical protein